MSFFDEIGGMLKQYTAANTEASPEQAGEHFDQVSGQMPQENIAGALGSLLSGGAGGTFGQNISQMFGQSNSTQQAGILSTLVASAAPEMLQSLGLGHLAGGQVTPEQASQVDPATVEALANHAQTQNPGIVEEASAFYSQHPALIKALGAAAVMLAMRHFANHAS